MSRHFVLDKETCSTHCHITVLKQFTMHKREAYGVGGRRVGERCEQKNSNQHIHKSKSDWYSNPLDTFYLA